MLVFSDENLEVIHRSGSSPYLLVTFNEMEMKANGSRFWGQRFCEKADISALGFISRRPNWFPAASVVKAVEATAPILRAAPERILYGHSQGGYAALRYRRRFNAAVAIAFCPQSLDRSEGRSFRWQVCTPFLARPPRQYEDRARSRSWPGLSVLRSVPRRRSPARGSNRDAAGEDAPRAGPHDRPWHRSGVHRNGTRPVADRSLPRRRSSGSTRSGSRSPSYGADASLSDRCDRDHPASGLGRPVSCTLRIGFLSGRASKLPLSSGQPPHSRR